MQSNDTKLRRELRRLAIGPSELERPDGLGIVRFVVSCPIDPSDVVKNVKTVIEAVDSAALAGWPEKSNSAPVLPDWFTAACSKEMSSEEATKWLEWWRGLSPEDQAKAELEKDWALPDWLYWMEPNNRQWFWWEDKVLENYDHIAVAIQVEAWPFPWGALRWLFRASGASSVIPEN